MIEVLIALALMLILLPAIAVIALLICLEDGGPVFFAQTRLGRDGQPFALLKFRKFKPDCGTTGQAVTVSGDNRLTRVGRWLEHTKLDELPQLWNILRGDMAIVGPRPESMFFADCFSGVHRGLLRYRPGIFGPAQALFRDEKNMYPKGCDPEEFYRQVLFPTKAQIDLAYYPDRSWLSDFGWICRCCLAVCGIAAGWRLGERPSLEMPFKARVDL
ncbi:sugar transferase [Rhodopila sp.]|uniref:sugar transferase n=1 Tax=Rhodopila sp. TaxID=2480087 RepID=UPI003D10422D